MKDDPFTAVLHRNRDVRFLAVADGPDRGREIGLKDRDRSALARMLRELIDLVTTTPVVHAGAVTKTLEVR